MESVKHLITEILPEIHPDAFLVSMSGSLETRLSLSVDTDAGITLGECAQINRGLRDALGARLGDAAVPELEVASPGIGEPLVLPRQYAQNLGRKLHIRLLNGGHLQGELLSIEDTQLTLGVITTYNPKSPHPPKQTPQSITWDEIVETKVILEYSA
ncbi:MAG: hypothetical protein KF690_08390 [Bacteroidetes bacterium]|nr:hypothetical protein [Bacteroidota bacterium]